MAQRNDVLVAQAIPDDAEPPLRARLAAFVPLTIALIGIGAILLGGVSARHDPRAEAPVVDTIATGSIAAE